MLTDRNNRYTVGLSRPLEDDGDYWTVVYARGVEQAVDMARAELMEEDGWETKDMKTARDMLALIAVFEGAPTILAVTGDY